MRQQQQQPPRQQGKTSKGEGKGRGPNMPAELQGMAARTASGQNICFGYNTARGCNNADHGKACVRGLHVCCVPGCFNPHPMSKHKSA